MAQFLGYNFPNYDSNDGLVNILTTQTVCICCLAGNISFISLAACKHSEFLQTFFKHKMDISRLLVCHECHNILKKIFNFSQQVHQSCAMLNEKLLHHKINKLHHLQHTKVKMLSIQPESTFTHEYYATLNEEHGEIKKCHGTVENIKTECNIVDIGIQILLHGPKEQKETVLSDSQVVKNEKKNTQKKDKTRATTIEDSCIDKLEVLVMNMEEMEKERQMLRNEDKYVKRSFKCEKCLISFDHEMNLNNHIERKHKKTGGCHVCNICECVYENETSLKVHNKRHFTRYKCKACSKQYQDERSAMLHYREKHGQDGAALKKYECNVEECGFETLSYRSYRYHLARHKQEPCPLCGKLYLKGTQLRIHINTVHEQASVFKCEQCEKRYKQRSGLNTHVQSAHGGAGAGAGAAPPCAAPYCPACRLHFRTRQIYMQHLRQHSNHVDKKYMCDECGARFGTKGNLKSHIEWAHLKVSNYMCPQCSKVLRSARSLQRHIDFVHEKKKLPRDKMCDYCGRGFTALPFLQAHIRTHTGERPYQCVHCSATFSQSAALYTHKKLIHNPERENARKRRKTMMDINAIDASAFSYNAGNNL